MAIKGDAAVCLVATEPEPEAPPIRLPQAFPFRFVDTVVSLTADELVATFDPGGVPAAFRGTAWLPAEIAIEGAAQSTILLFERIVEPLGPGDFPMLGQVQVQVQRTLRWDKPILFRVRPERYLSDLGIFRVQVLSGGEPALEGRIAVALRRAAPVVPKGGEALAER